MGFAYATFAGLATVLGCLAIPLVTSGLMAQEKLTAGALAFAAGVMLWVAFVDVLGGGAVDYFEGHFAGQDEGGKADPVSVRLGVAFFFFLGVAITMLMDIIVERYAGPVEGEKDSRDVELSSEAHDPLPGPGETATGTVRGQSIVGMSQSDAGLRRVALIATVALTMHNFPEGLATFFDGSTGSVTVALAIAMHNIPEGAAVAVPTFQISNSYSKAFWASFMAGAAQPLGALLGWLLIIVLGFEIVPDFIYAAMYSLTAGIMVAISIAELLPEALKVATPRFAAMNAFAGFLVMEFSIICITLTE